MVYFKMRYVVRLDWRMNVYRTTNLQVVTAEADKESLTTCKVLVYFIIFNVHPAFNIFQTPEDNENSN